ncbi:proteinaceous RNase P 2-like isoform X1 [Primulina eburnea]|uniref:proteinaceous RNase P 2-like isoform X1 n=1 Tax=Primulina eburnea TaxID=1245227 RepID=UPI003C6C639B
MTAMNRRWKKQKLTPEAQFRATLDHCSRTKNLFEAISLYESSDAPTLSLNNLNSLLYICSNSVSDPETRKPAIEFGFKLFHQNNGNLKPNEATITAVSRLAAAKGDGDYAFELAKRVKDHGVAPKLRTFSPALICFCDGGMADKAYEVEEHVQAVGLQLEEPELVALLKVSMEASRLEKVYEYLHKLRVALRGVNQPAMELIENWFRENHATEMGSISLSENQLKEALLRNGGGWHGLGWLGEGVWIVQRSNIASDGKCSACDEQLVCVDIDRAETEKFEQSIASFAMEREAQSNFKEFQDWLEKHSDYETVIDGANIGLYQQNFAEGGFSIEQLDAVVQEVHNSSKKWPLVVLHKKRVRSLLEDASKRELIEEWIDKGILYGTPYGSNDDWYWLYATVKLKCFLLTNDEMRDHIFALLGSNFFFRWKERHQVRYTFMKGNPKLLMPPLYSLVIQESVKGSWHVPSAEVAGDERCRTWLCVTRPGSNEAEKVSHNNHVSNNSCDGGDIF